MRILIVHNILNDSRSVSGVLREYAHMANAWIEAGHQTDFLAAKAGWPQLCRLAPKAGLLNSDGIFNATRYLSKTWLYFPAYAYRMLTAHWLRLPCRYDVVYASSQFIVEVYAAIVVARRQEARLVVKIQHVLATQSHRKGFFDRLFLWAERRSARWIQKRADLLLCLSAVVGKDYNAFERSLGLTPSKIVPSGCGIDLGAFAGPATAKQFDAVFLGRIHEQKGIFELPAVWKRIRSAIPEARLLIIGEGPHRERTAQAFAELGLKGSVTFTGGIEEAQKNQMLMQSRVGISLSYEEGWGLSVTEFLAAGLPVVAYDLPVFAEVFPNQLEIVKPHDQEAAADRVIALLRDEPRRCALGQRGRQFVARYDFRLMAQAELGRLKDVLGPEDVVLVKE